MKLFLASVLLLLASSAWALKPNQKRLMLDKKSKQCFYTESVRKTAKFGWVNEKKAKQISKIKRKKVVAASSPVNVRKVFVPKTWCQGS
ncbi:MAG: hypothetical protein JNL11_00430 [Bdellovibrionaceae bacterium]|nr:hypothetical protein [Pseudobdellovibrionaceae bacterium]